VKSLLAGGALIFVFIILLVKKGIPCQRALRPLLFKAIELDVQELYSGKNKTALYREIKAQPGRLLQLEKQAWQKHCIYGIYANSI